MNAANYQAFRDFRKHVDIKHAMVLGTIFINDRYNKIKEMHITDKVVILAVK